MQPIYLFADSQLLFWRENGRLFLDSVRETLTQAAPKAAYVGASNGDHPDFYAIFEAAMEGIGVRDCRMIRASFSVEDEAFVNQADIILLAGGDVERGWKVFEEVGLKDIIVRRYEEGALLLGISAGAVQLGLFGWGESPASTANVFDALRLVPFIVGAHEEKEEWTSLRRMVRLKMGYARGIGIPTGGGMIYHADGSIEPVRFPLHEFSLKDDEMTQDLLLPASSEEMEARASQVEGQDIVRPTENHEPS